MGGKLFNTGSDFFEYDTKSKKNERKKSMSRTTPK